MRPPHLILFAILLLACAVAQAEPPSTITGKVISIADGDTITVLVEKTEHKIRFSGIDCPERKQAFGAKAKKFTGDRAFGKQVTVEVVDRDRYGRDIGMVILPDGSNLNHALVKAGLAWWYRKYSPKDKTLESLESAARKARVGLWSDPKPIPPWGMATE